MAKRRRRIEQQLQQRYTNNNEVGFRDEQSEQSSVYDYDGNNPLKKRRKCRDVFCLIIFVSYFTLMVGVALYAYLHGDYRRLIYGVDSNCDICGIENNPKKGFQLSGKDQREFPYLFFHYADQLYYRSSLELPLNADFINVEIFFVKQCLVSCPPDYKVVMNRCQPNVTTSNNGTGRDDQIESRMLSSISGERDFLVEVTEDLENTWPVIVWMCVISLGTAMLMTLFLRTLAGAVVWIVILGVAAAAVCGTVFLWLYYVSLADQAEVDGDASQNNSDPTNIFGWDKNKKFYTLLVSIIATLVCLVILALAIGMRKRLTLVIRLFQEAGKAVHSMPLILLQPFWTFAALVSVLVASFSLGILIETAGFEQKYISPEEPTERCKYVKDDIIRVSRWLNIFAFFWFTQFIIGCQHFIIAGAVSRWFFTRKKSTISWPILRSLDRLIMYHMGSVAFGALVIAVVKIVRLILNFIQKRLSKNSGLCRVLSSCCQCCTWCLENILIYLNRNAYVEIAIYGHGFCKAARNAFSILVQNALRVAAINSIGDFILYMAKAGTVIIAALVGYQMMHGRPEIHNLWIPLIIGSSLSYFISHCFVSVYDMAIDTIFLCFCEDCAQNDGVTRPYFMSTALMQFVKQSQVDLREMSASTTTEI